MRASKFIRNLRIASLFSLVLTAQSIGSAEHLPIKTYTTADGLLRDSVYRIRQDSRGFLWLCTNGGLSRFDGYGFTNYTMSDGLPIPAVNDLVETSDGTIWVATSNGVVRFNPRGTRAPYSPQASQTSNLMFEVFAPGDNKSDKEISVLLADENGMVWVGTNNGLYRMRVNAGRPQFEKTTVSYTSNSLTNDRRGEFENTAISHQMTSLIKDHRGELWAGTYWDGLYRLSADAATVLQYFTSEQGLPKVYGAPCTTITALVEDKQGNIWVGTHDAGVCQLALDSRSGRYAVLRCYGKKDGLSHEWVNSIVQSVDGSLWIATAGGLNRISGNNSTNNLAFQTFTAAQGFCDDGVFDIAEDRDGNSWIGTQCGLKKWTAGGFTIYDTKDGLSSLSPTSFLETVDDEMIVTGFMGATAGWALNLFSGGKFKAIRPAYPSDVSGWGWGWKQTVLQTRSGEWWMAAGMSSEYMRRFKEMPLDGPLVVRYPKVRKLEDLERVKPKAVYRPRDGLFGYNTFRLYQDHNGDVWIVTLDPTRLSKWEHKTEKFQEFTEAADMGGTGYIYVLREDRAGNLWMGAGITFRHDENQTFSLMRYNDGRFTWFTTADGLPEGPVRDLLIDGVGRLWIATSRGGVLRVDDTNAERLHFTAYTTEQGLSDNTTSSLTEDRFGRIYIGSGRGVDRLDPATGTVKHFTTADGLPREEIYASYRDRTGALWFGSTQGLARYVPEPEQLREPPNILLTGLRVSNVEQRVSALGETEFPRFEFEAAQNNLGVDFLALGTTLGEELRYKYELEGADAEWITTSQRTVNFSNLAPGKYRFLVKAITAEGIESPNPAGFTFTILHPVWQRWWFLLLVTGLAAAGVYALYRYRLTQLIRLERVRTSIAADLHDDIGSNLSVIAGLSDVLRRQTNGENAATNKELSLIAAVSQRSLEAMSDIVWAVNPKKDHLQDLTRRMRLFADEAFFPHNIELRFSAADAGGDARVDAETRRAVFLIFKEAVNNIIRHSRCSTVDALLTLDHKTLILEVSDNGRGFDPEHARAGEGLASMRRRAEKIGGEIEVVSKSGEGATVRLRAPLG